MSSNPFFLISILINALVTFVTVVVVVESFLVIFKIKQGRVRSILRFFPFLSLFLDLLWNSFSVGYWLNPLNCGSCVQKLLLTFFFPELKNYLYSNEISLLTYLGLEISHTVFSIAFVLFWIMTLYFTSRLLFEGFILAKVLRSMRKSEDICSRSIKNILLAAALQKSNVTIFSSEKVTIPMATYPKTIFIPSEIVKEFTQEEFETIVAHELEHVLWKDPTIRLFSQLISKIFWWVPTGSWKKKLEFDQEIACDQSILKYGFKEEFLASALMKVTRSAKKKTYKTICYLSNEKHPSVRRIQIMLGLVSTSSRSYKWVNCTVVTIGSFIALVCALWIK
jgi:beta-lactamase regulating signal transducer with metallopeptidase domain